MLSIPLTLAAPCHPVIVAGVPPTPGHPLAPRAPFRGDRLPTPPRPVRAMEAPSWWRQAAEEEEGESEVTEDTVEEAGEAVPPPPTKYVPPPRRARAALAALATAPAPLGAAPTAHLDAVATWCHSAAERGRADAAGVVADTTARALLDAQLAAASSGEVQRAPWYRDRPRTKYPVMPGGGGGGGGYRGERDHDRRRAPVALQPAAARPMPAVGAKATVVGTAPFIPAPETQASPDGPLARERRVLPPEAGSAAAMVWGAWPGTGL